MKRLLKVHEDVITVPEMMKKLRSEYEAAGYNVKEIHPVAFQLILDDGEVSIYWEKGRVYEEIKEEPEEGGPDL